MESSQLVSPPHDDVVICGGGLAGLCLARQLRLQMPDLNITVLEKIEGPLPDACFKVGESSVEVGTHYYDDILQLGDYLSQHQIRKFGLRFYTGNSQGPLESRPELGLSIMPPVPSYQLDRGIFENDLRSFATAMGINVIEGVAVKDILLSESEAPHVISYQQADGKIEQRSCRWVVDAMGRRLFLQKKLDLLIRDNGHHGSSSWFRIEGRVDVSELVPKSDRQWHSRTVEPRWMATNHFMGMGYWVWIIPLASGHTSIGIVTDESIHPYNTYATSYEKSLQWLERHEPILAAHLKTRTMLDFKAMKNYSYSSRQVFGNRWTCVGEAAVFPDPFYSPGSDFIGAGNSITTTLIQLDRERQLDSRLLDFYNDYFLNVMLESALEVYRGSYVTFGHTQIYTSKHQWDALFYWGCGPAQIFFQGFTERPDQLKMLLPVMRRTLKLQKRVQQLMRDWARRAPPREVYRFFDISLVPCCQLLALDLMTRKSMDQFLMDLNKNIHRLEELANLLFFQAVEEVMPERMGDLPANRWINAWGISLDPERWEADGLFRPLSEPRDLKVMQHAHLRWMFAPLPLFDRTRDVIQRRFTRLFKGRLFYSVIGFMTRNFVKGRGRLPRLLFLRDQPFRFREPMPYKRLPAELAPQSMAHRS